MAKKACIVHTPRKSDEAQAVASKLKGYGYDVSVTEVSASEAASIQSGDASTLPPGVRACMEDADVCILILDDDVSLGGFGQLASDQGCKVVSVGGEPEDLPDELDDIIDAHLPDGEDPRLLDAVEGDPVRAKGDGSTAAPRKPPRVKCQ